jgi:F0F1-type ATP synthase assembly protein I
MPRDDDGDSKLAAVKKLYLLGTVGVQLAVSIVIGFLMGLGLDRWLGTGPLFMLVFIFFGVAAGFLNVYRVAMKEGAD